MAVNRTHTDAAPSAVWDVLADGWTYSNWVVGTSHMRAVEAAWPDVGTRLFHAAGVWPVMTRDETRVEECDPGRRLVLLARGRPFGTARVVMELEADDDGTQVTMVEEPVSGPGKWLHNSLSEAALHRRNTESLERLAALCERRTEPRE
jgi:hypothetical protein